MNAIFAQVITSSGKPENQLPAKMASHSSGYVDKRKKAMRWRSTRSRHGEDVTNVPGSAARVAPGC
jgi:hypothetical protein